MDVGRGDALLLQLGNGSVEHRRRPAHVGMVLADIATALLHEGGNQPASSRPVAVFGFFREHRHELEAPLPLLGDLRHLRLAVQVLLCAGAVEVGAVTLYALRHGLLQQCLERRHAAAPGDAKHWRVILPQPEVAAGPGDGQLRVLSCAGVQPFGEGAARHLAHVEDHAAVTARLGPAGERIGAMFGHHAGHLEIGVLAGLVRDRPVELDGQLQDVVSQRLHGADATAARDLFLGAGRRIEIVHGDGQIAAGDRLAGENVVLLQLFRRQQIGLVGIFLDLAVEQANLAGAAAADSAAVGYGSPRVQRCGEQERLVVDFDRFGDAFDPELEWTLVALEKLAEHAIPTTDQRATRPGPGATSCVEGG